MDIAQGRLQPLCIKALKRVFIMSDKNQVSQLFVLCAGLDVWPLLPCSMAVYSVTCFVCGTPPGCGWPVTVQPQCRECSSVLYWLFAVAASAECSARL